MVKKLYKFGKSKAITLSFDDGQAQDIRLANIFNKYGLKATFNIMGGNCKNGMFREKENDVSLWDGSNELREAYAGHEIASHTYTHPHLMDIPLEEGKEEITKDIAALEKAFGTKIKGFAAPYGKIPEELDKTLAENGILYDRLTGRVTDFSIPDNFLRWVPSFHMAFYGTDEGKQAVADFFETDKELALLYIWGHSYEITDLDCAGCKKWNGMRNRWQFTEEMCKAISNKDDVYYATNIEICEYLLAMKKAIVSDTYIDNPTDTELYFSINGKVIVAPPHSRFGV